MFVIYKWPKKSKNSHRRSGRPKQKSSAPKANAATSSIVDELLNKGLIDDNQYNTALWIQKAHALYMTAIGAPRLKTTCMDLSQLKGDQWTTYQLKKIEKNWQRIQSILKQRGLTARKNILQTLCFETQCDNTQAIRHFLDDIQAEFKSISCKKDEHSLKLPS